MFFQSKPEIGTFGEKMVNVLAHLTNDLNFTSSLKERNWHKPAGSSVLETVLQMVGFQQTTY